MLRYRVLCFSLLVAAVLAPRPARAEPMHRVLSQDARGLEVEFNFPRPTLTDVVIDGRTYTRVTLPDAFSRSLPGEPAMPCYGVPFSVPPGTRASFSLQVLEEETLTGGTPLPMSATTFKGDHTAPTARETYLPDPAVYSRPGLFPGDTALLTPVDEWRFYHVQSLVLFPVRVDATGHSYRWIKHARVQVSFEPVGESSRTASAPAQGRGWESLAKNLLVNADTAVRSRGTAGGPLRAASQEAPQPGIRVQIGSSGLVRLPFADLEDAGFEAGTPVGDVRVEERNFNDDAISGNPYQVNNIPRRVEDTDQNGAFGPGDFLMFYAENYRDRFHPQAVDERYDRFHVYWVTDGGSGAPYQMVASLTATPDVTPATFKSTVRAEKDQEYTHVPNEDGAGFYPTHTSLFWRGPSDKQPLDASILTPDPAPAGQVRFSGYWRGNFLSGDFNRHVESVVFNSNTVLERSVFYGVNDLNWVSAFMASAGLLHDGSNAFRVIGERLTSQGYQNGSGAYFDYLQIEYDRLLHADGDQLWFNSQGYSGVAAFSVSGFSSPDIWVLDVTVPSNPVRVEAEITSAGGAYTARIVRDVTGSSRRYFAFVPASFSGLPATPYTLPVDIAHMGIIGAGAVQDLSQAGQNSDYIIITHPNFRDAMERLADYRRSQGLKTFVCEVQEVYDQFAGGHKTPDAIKSFLRMAYQTWDTPPSYVVLGGDANEDYRGDTSQSTTDWVPTMMATANVPGSLGVKEIAGSDPWFGQGLGEGEGLVTVAPDVFVGRLPCNTLAEANRTVTKILTYEAPAPDNWKNRAVFQADDQYSQGLTVNSAYRYQPSEILFNTTTAEVINRIASEGRYTKFNAVPFYQSDYLDTVDVLGRTNSPGDTPSLIDTRYWVDDHLSPVLVDTLAAGGLLWEYTGHANASLMATEAILHVQEEIPELKNLGRPYVFLGFACHLNEFERALEKRGRCIGEVLLDLENRGAVVSFASPGYELLSTNGPTQLAVSAAMFWDVPRDPDTGRQRRIVGEVLYAGMYKLYLTTGGTNYFELNRTYFMLGDPAMTMDIASPELEVKLNGEAVESGTPLVTSAFGDSLTFTAHVSEDVDVKSLTATRGGVPAGEEDLTLTPLSESESGLQEYALEYKTALAFGNSDFALEAQDWTGGVTRFEMPAHLDFSYWLDGDPFQPDGEELIEPQTVLEVEVNSPAVLSREAFSVTVDGFPVSLAAAESMDEGHRWHLTLAQEWHAGPPLTVAVRVSQGEEQVEQSVLLRVPTETLNLESVAFYPNPMEGPQGTLIYYLTNKAEHVDLKIYSVRGRSVLEEPLEGKPGWNYFTWAGEDALGDPVANGVYLAVIHVGSDIRHLERIVVSR